MQSTLKTALPPQTPAYRVCVNGRFGHLEAVNARIQVSVGNPRYEGQKLHALADFCRKRYGQTTVIVSDTLQRHNRDEPFRWWTATRREGDEWISRNQETLRGFQIVRWDHLLSQDDYALEHAEIRHLTAHGAALAALHDTAAAFSRRHDAPLSACLDFLVEELAVFAMLFKEPAVDIYAGSWISGLFQVIPHPSFQKFHCLSVDFERLKSIA